MGIFDGLKGLLGNSKTSSLGQFNREKLLKDYQQRVDAINGLETSYEKLSDEELKGKTKEFRNRLIHGESLDSLLTEAFAVVREASWRVLGLRHFDVQLLGGMALHDGRLAEMATGEGKTLVAVLPTYLNALSGKGVFVVTTNDYLARRDGETMGQIHRFLGLSVGILQNQQSLTQRKAAYLCDVVYLTNQELGFDFLRDNLAMTTEEIVQTKPYHFCIVDEADSILIDEAKTPLIISRSIPEPTHKIELCAKVSQSLVKDRDYTVDLKQQRVAFTANGFKNAEQLLGRSLNEMSDPWILPMLNALRAKELYAREKEYIVRDQQIAIVDSFTGRVLEGRKFSDGVQQAIEAKESLQISGQAQIIAKITYQNLFQLFPKFAGMTGTALTDAAEFQSVYRLEVLPIPTALPIARRDYPDAVFRSKTGKMKALLKNVLSNHRKGRPILIGTTSVEFSEELVEALQDIGIAANLLNAKPENIEKESEIIAQAGRWGAVTVATNMAGRGTDILLGGSVKGLVKSITKFFFFYRMNLLTKNEIIVRGGGEEGADLDPSPTEEEEEESQSVDRSDETGKPSSSLNIKSFSETMIGAEEEEEDDAEEASDTSNELEAVSPELSDLPSILDIVKGINLWIPTRPSLATERALQEAVLAVCSRRLGEKTNRLDIEELLSLTAESSQSISAPELQSLHRAMERLIEEFTPAIERERERVKAVGGLYVIGTARHESRRIDNQLRGRSGRQGDPGTTRFFLSLEDDLFCIFGADKLSSLLSNFRVEEDMPIESDLVVQALDKVQAQVESYYASIREQIYRLDAIAAEQRQRIYQRRQQFLVAQEEEILEAFQRFCMETVEDVYYANLLNPERKGQAIIYELFANNCLDLIQCLVVVVRGKSTGPVNYEKLYQKMLQFFPNLSLTMNELKQIPTSEILPFLKERLTLAMMEKQKEIDQYSSWSFLNFFRYMSLIQIDESWAKHLTRLTFLQEEIVAESIVGAERNPLDSYREKATKVFMTLLDEVRRNTIYSVFIYRPQQASSSSFSSSSSPSAPAASPSSSLIGS